MLLLFGSPLNIIPVWVFKLDYYLSIMMTDDMTQLFVVTNFHRPSCYCLLYEREWVCFSMCTFIWITKSRSTKMQIYYFLPKLLYYYMKIYTYIYYFQIVDFVILETLAFDFLFFGEISTEMLRYSASFTVPVCADMSRWIQCLMLRVL